MENTQENPYWPKWATNTEEPLAAMDARQEAAKVLSVQYEAVHAHPPVLEGPSLFGKFLLWIVGLIVLWMAGFTFFDAGFFYGSLGAFVIFAFGALFWGGLGWWMTELNVSDGFQAEFSRPRKINQDWLDWMTKEDKAIEEALSDPEYVAQILAVQRGHAA